MLKKSRVCLLALSSLLVFACSKLPEDHSVSGIDSYSYNLGLVSAFSEMVGAGVKQLAFSAALPPLEMDRLQPEAEKIAQRHLVRLYREDELIVSHLFPADAAAGKSVLLIYRGDTLDIYLALKEEMLQLQAAGRYDEQAKTRIGIRLGQLLSYPPERIEHMIRRNTSQGARH
jgi:hypothetical protein